MSDGIVGGDFGFPADAFGRAVCHEPAAGGGAEEAYWAHNLLEPDFSRSGCLGDTAGAEAKRAARAWRFLETTRP